MKTRALVACAVLVGACGRQGGVSDEDGSATESGDATETGDAELEVSLRGAAAKGPLVPTTSTR